MSLGGGRKGLPASFMNRFTKIFVEEYATEELEIILKELYSNEEHMIADLIGFTKTLVKHNHFSKVNLRDLLRFCELYTKSDRNIELSFEVAFNRKDSEKFFKTTNTSSSAVKCLSSHIPVSYSYINENNERICMLSSQRKRICELQMMIDRCSKHCSSFIIQGKQGTGKSTLISILS